jgi:hypothetical protein
MLTVSLWGHMLFFHHQVSPSDGLFDLRCRNRRSVGTAGHNDCPAGYYGESPVNETRLLEDHAVLGVALDDLAVFRYLKPDGVQDRNDGVLLALDSEFRTIGAELRDFCAARGGCDEDEIAGLERLEAILARLEPIERAIMATQTETLAGLAVKARHAAHVLSEHWEEPIERLDWDRRIVRLLIEAVCHVAGVSGALTHETSSATEL